MQHDARRQVATRDVRGGHGNHDGARRRRCHGGGRAGIPDSRPVFSYYPNSVAHLYPSEQITPGVSGVTRFSTNSYGTRGRQPTGQERLRILTVGGSTTACTVLDDQETWPAVLERLLDPGGNNAVWVANSGVDGLLSHHHLMHAKYLLPTLPRIDYVIVYAGLNDMGLWLHRKEFDPDYLRDSDNWSNRVGEAFRWSAYTPADWPIYKRAAL